MSEQDPASDRGEQLDFFPKDEDKRGAIPVETENPKPSDLEARKLTPLPATTFTEQERERLGIILNEDGTRYVEKGVVHDGPALVAGMTGAQMEAVVKKLSQSKDARNKKAAEDIKNTEWWKARQKELWRD